MPKHRKANMENNYKRRLLFNATIIFGMCRGKSHTLESQFQVINQIQTGGCGTVFLARYKQTQSLVAVKVVPFIHHYSRKSFQAEVNTTKMLSACHSSVKFIDSFTDSSCGYLLMEPHTGDLLDIMSHLNEPKIKSLFQQICTAVKYCHDNQVAHLDIKPENILISKTGQAVLCDYGAAHHFDAPLQATVGTIQYNAPETQGSLHYNKASADIFSLGVLLHVLLTNTFPYAGESEEEVCKNIIQGNLDLSGLKSEPISPASKELLAKMLCMDPSQRLTIDQILGHKWFF